MDIRPPNAAPFLGSSGSAPLEGRPALLGVGYDGTTSFRPGARRGPDAIRAVSEGIETYSPALDRDLGDRPFADLGNLEVPYGAPEPVAAALHAACAEIFEEGAAPFVLGGEHSVTPGAVRAAFDRHPDLAVVQFDAHADLRESWMGSRHSHACAMRRVLDFLPPERLLQVGVRSGTREEFAEMRRLGSLVPPRAPDLAEGLRARGLDGAPLYITFDLDFFDPSLLPGTGTPEPGGPGWGAFEALRSVFDGRRIVALDVVELAPDLDPTGVSSVVAAKTVREWLLADFAP